jgi:two-component system phosphate regulon response regulator PhoB
MSGAKILIVEDEVDIAELVRYNLELAKHQVKLVHSGDEALNAVKNFNPSLVLLDIMLPGLSGLQICQAMKADPQLQKIPVILVSAKGEENDVVRGLELGADDYVTKPFSPKVLLARVEAVLRRAQSAEPIDEKGMVIRGLLKVDPGRVEVTVDGQPVDLTQSEFKILHFLAQRPGWVYTRGQIVEAIHGGNYAVTDRTIDFQMVGLRKKLGPVGDHIETVRGVGYRFKEEK